MDIAATPPETSLGAALFLWQASAPVSMATHGNVLGKKHFP